MKKLCLAFLFCLLSANSFALVWPVLKVDCVPELNFFEVRLLRFEQIPGKESFLDKSASIGSSEYKFLKEKYGIIHEYSYVRYNPRTPDDNYMSKECVIGEDKYTINIDHRGTTISKGNVVLAKELFFSSAWTDWTIWRLIYNAKQQEFLVSGEFTFNLPLLYFRFSTKDGGVLDENVIKAKGQELEQKVAAGKRLNVDGEYEDKNMAGETLYRFDEAFLPLVIDLKERNGEE